MRIIKTFLLLCAVFSMEHALALSKRAMYADYQKITYSVRGGSMRIVCDQGFTRFRLVSKMATRPRLYWQDGRRWIELKDVAYNDTSVVFEGMGKEGGVPVPYLMTGIELPLFNERPGLSAADYFYKSRTAGFSEYVYIIDMVNQQMTFRNIEPIVDYLMLDRRKYLLEQAWRSPERALTVNQSEQQQQEQSQRTAVLEQAAAQYNREVRVVTPQLHHEQTSDCYPD